MESTRNADYPRDLCIHDLIEEQVKRTPEAIAVQFEEESLTYKELDRTRGSTGRKADRPGS